MISLVEHRFQLKIENNQITRILDTLSNQVIQSFAAPLTSQSYKLYVITKNKTILYIGTTKGSIKNRLRGGLKANGANGYHGYKWKIHETISLSVWNFETLNKEQMVGFEF